MNNRVVLMIGNDELPWAIANGLMRRFGPLRVLVEDREPHVEIIRRRLRMLGLVEVAGQVAFGVLLKLLSRRAATRRRQLLEEAGLDPRPLTGWPTKFVDTVNGAACRRALTDAAPDVVVVIGTRLIRWETLECVGARFINYHAGITPNYRGQNGMYWALAEDDPEHAGVTVHLIDEGVDTGDVLYQAKVRPQSGDNIATYQYRQAGVAVPMLVKAIEDALAGRLAPRRVQRTSRQWFHPTIWHYIKTGFRRGVW